MRKRCLPSAVVVPLGDYAPNATLFVFTLTLFSEAVKNGSQQRCSDNPLHI